MENYNVENNKNVNIYEQFINLVYECKYGIMGTIAFHLILAIVLVASQINSIQKPQNKEIVVDFDQDIEKKIEEIKEKIERREEIKKATTDEEVKKLLKSIAVNENIKKGVPKNTNSEINKLIKDIQKDLDANNGNRYKKSDKEYKSDSIKYSKYEAQRKLDSIQTVYYSGPSSVSYKLKGRYQEYLPIPVFKCEQSGKVIVEIHVNSYGRVTKTRILEGKSLSEDECLIDTALDAAKRSRFNESSMTLQIGTITYNFVKQ